jgi:hypothetical protein
MYFDTAWFNAGNPPTSGPHNGSLTITSLTTGLSATGTFTLWVP